jgi:hypothetical protein
MKYRMLSNEELEHLEGDLKAFLILNGVAGDDWKALNETDPDKAIALVELFSDKVLETVYEKVEYLEHRSPDMCLVFHLGEKDQSLITIQRTEGSSLDLSTPEGIHEALTKRISELEFFTSKHAYHKEREMEVHKLITQGCVLSTKEFWDALMEVISAED